MTHGRLPVRPVLVALVGLDGEQTNGTMVLRVYREAVTKLIQECELPDVPDQADDIC